MRRFSFVLIALASLLAPALFAQDGLTVDVEPVVEGKAVPGGEYRFKLSFTVPEGYHAYHKDNPGYNTAVMVQFKELSGLVLKEEIWPEPYKHIDDFSEEWELSGVFEIEYVFSVPRDAQGTLEIKGNHDTQFCDETGCLQADGEFSAVIEVAEGAAPADPEVKLEDPTVTASAEFEGEVTAGEAATLKVRFDYTDGYHAFHEDTPGFGSGPEVKFVFLDGLKRSDPEWPKYVEHEYEEDWIEWEYPDELTLTYSLPVPEDLWGERRIKIKWRLELGLGEDTWDFDGELEPSVTVKPLLSDATDEHGFYVDFDYALEKAKQEEKQLLVDFNGRY